MNELYGGRNNNNNPKKINAIDTEPKYKQNISQILYN